MSASAGKTATNTNKTVKAWSQRAVSHIYVGVDPTTPGRTEEEQTTEERAKEDSWRLKAVASDTARKPSTNMLFHFGRIYGKW